MTARQGLDRTILIARDFVPAHRSDEAILGALQNVTVALVADERNLASIQGQAALTTAALLVLRLGCRLRLVFPEMELRGHQPPIGGRELRRGLLELAGGLIPGGDAEVAQRTRSRDLAFILGDTPWQGRARHAWRLHGSRWTGAISLAAAGVGRWTGDFPIGALAAATIAAAEPFKLAMRSLLGARYRDFDELMPVRACTVALGPENLDPAAFDVGRIDCVSGGAIVQAFAHALFRVPGVTGDLRVIEPERLDMTNLNRYALTRLSDLGALKWQIISASAPPRINVTGAERRLDEASSSLLRSSRTVVVGTDNVVSRWIAQSVHPEWLAVGATAKFLAVCSEHAPGLACARCMHPIDDDVEATIPTISFVSYWGGLMLAARVLQRAAGQACGAGDQSLTLGALHLDGRYAQWQHPVVFQPACPLACGRAA